MKKQYSASFKAQMVREIMKEEKTLVQIAREKGIPPQQLTGLFSSDIGLVFQICSEF